MNGHASYQVGGTISGLGGSSALVELSGNISASQQADASGNYVFSGVSNGSYTITPTSPGNAMTPANQSVTVLDGDVTGVNFSSASATYTISGTISGAGGSGALVTLNGASSASVTAN